ncbi:MAG: sodium-dependent transporter [Peptoniphilaceae bacterium]|nr:sodium-dependent transporter [Peptoniphilaceae bacterium]MDY3738610.1 sodium-dependent transporter [Peptoniphilaceae bacterium]
MESKNEGFSSIIGFITVAIGLALGIGTLWRFPYVVGENGGAVFIFFYILIILVIGIPLMTAEVTIGFHTQKAAVDAYKKLEPKNSKWHLTGYLHLVAAIIIVAYTAPIYSWILKYIFSSITGTFESMSVNDTVNFFYNLNQNKFEIFIFFILNIALNILVINLGIQDGIERLSKVLIPILFIIMVIIIISTLKLKNSFLGISFMFKPDFSKFSISSLLTCLGQAFFALGLGMLASMVFGSYIKNPKENIFKSCSIICFALILAGILAGLMILPVVFSSGLSVDEGVSLTFITLPVAFNKVSGGKILSTLFYFGFYIAAFTSSVGVMESIVGFFSEKFNIERKKALIISTVLISIIAIISIFSDDAFNFFDILESNYILVISCFLIVIFSSRIWKIEEVIKSANIKNKFIKYWMKFSLKYISPVAILVIFISNFIK